MLYLYQTKIKEFGMSENRHGTFNFEIIGLILIMLVVVIVIVLSIISKNNQYNEMLVNIENKQW